MVIKISLMFGVLDEIACCFGTGNVIFLKTTDFDNFDDIFGIITKKF